MSISTVRFDKKNLICLLRDKRRRKDVVVVVVVVVVVTEVLFIIIFLEIPLQVILFRKRPRYYQQSIVMK